MRAALAGLAGYVYIPPDGGSPPPPPPPPPPSVTYNPVPGTYYQDDGGAGSVEYLITASEAVVWNWSANSTLGLTSSLSSGSSATEITFTLGGGVSGRTVVITVTVGTSTWQITLSATGYGGGGGGGGPDL